MAIAELVLKYLDTLVWPVVTVVLVWMLRAQIRQAFGRLTRLETPAGTLEFEAEARAVRDEADDLRAPVVEGPADEGVPLPDPGEVPDGGSRGGGADARAQPSDLPPSGSRRRRDHLLDMAEHAPLQAMTEAWGSLVWSGLDVLRTRGRAAPKEPERLTNGPLNCGGAWGKWVSRRVRPPSSNAFKRCGRGRWPTRTPSPLPPPVITSAAAVRSPASCAN